MCRACDDATLRARDEDKRWGMENAGRGDRLAILTIFYHDDFEMLNFYARPFFIGQFTGLQCDTRQLLYLQVWYIEIFRQIPMTSSSPDETKS